MVVTPLVSKRGRDAQGYIWLAEKLRRAILNGDIRVGESLPPVKRLGADHGVAPETARRAAKQLEREGLLAAEPRQGFRVLARVNDPERGLPIAFVVSAAEQPGMWDDFHRLLLAALQSAAAERGWAFLAVGMGNRSGQEVMEQLRDCRACGLVLDSVNAALVAAVSRVGLPTVMMDAWEPEMRLDAVAQDSFQGALLATRHLLERGHRRIAWLGPASQSVQSRERYGGFCAALAGSGADIVPDFMRDVPWQEVPASAREMLRRPDRPTAALGMWYGAAEAWHRAAAELGLSPGRDFELVGWASEESYDGAYRALFGAGPVPATMVWSVTELARLTVARLAERRVRPEMPPALIKVPVRLRPAGGVNP